jgi:hypothetical protein
MRNLIYRWLLGADALAAVTATTLGQSAPAGGSQFGCGHT